MASLSRSNGVRSGTATQAGTYTFYTKDKYNDADIAFKVPTGSAKVNSVSGQLSSWTLTGSSGKVSVGASANATVTGSATAGWVTGVTSGSATFSGSHDFTDANFIADNIKSNTTIFGVTGTLDYISTQFSVPTTKVTSIIKVGSTYYLWR